MSETSKLRQIKPIKMPDVLPASIMDEEKPEFEWVDPSTLYIEEKYQRNLGKKSITLIRKIVKDFDWTRFKPPVCSWGADKKLFVIDGQHTAIAAASHPKVSKIPVMVVEARTMKNRATSFMSHNRDRVAITPMQLFYSSVVAEDPVALAAKKALDGAGCTVMRYMPPTWQVGQTMGIGTILGIAERKGAVGLERVLQILVDAKRAPVTASEVAAVADLLWGKGWEGKFDDRDLSLVIRSKSMEQWQADAESQVRKGQAMPMKRAVAIVWYKHVPKKRTKGDKIPIKTL